MHRKKNLPEVQVDPEQLKEALANLIENACEAMKGMDGKIFINEDVSYAGDSGPSAVIRLTDTGPGIPKSIREKVFQPFFSTKEEGSGLGLSITTRIIEEHGGSLNLTSKRNEGATFIIALPVKEEDIEHDTDH